MHGWAWMLFAWRSAQDASQSSNKKSRPGFGIGYLQTGRTLVAWCVFPVTHRNVPKLYFKTVKELFGYKRGNTALEVYEHS